MAKKSAAPLMTDENVREFLKILRENNVPAMSEILAVVTQVGAMEKQLEAAAGELAALRRELAETRMQDHPLRHTLQKAASVMQKQVHELAGKLDALKESLISGCTSAIEAFHDKGIIAFDSLARFFRVKPALENMRNSLESSIQFNDKAIVRIGAMSAEYHEAERHIRNMGRALAGKEAVQEAKSPGLLAMLAAAPFRAERGHFVAMKRGVEAAIASMTRLEARAAERKAPIRQTLAAMQEKAERDRAERPAPPRTRKMEQEI